MTLRFSFLRGNSGNGRIVVRRCTDQAEIAALPGLEGNVDRFFGFSTGGTYFAARYSDGRSVIWDIKKQQRVIEGLGWRSAEFSSDSQEFIACGDDGQVKRIQLNRVRSEPGFTIPRSYGLLRLRPQGNQLAGCCDGGLDIEIRDLSGGSLRKSLSHP